MTGFENRVFLLAPWARSYLFSKRGARLITEREWRLDARVDARLPSDEPSDGHGRRTHPPRSGGGRARRPQPRRCRRRHDPARVSQLRVPALPGGQRAADQVRDRFGDRLRYVFRRRPVSESTGAASGRRTDGTPFRSRKLQGNAHHPMARSDSLTADGIRLVAIRCGGHLRVARPARARGRGTTFSGRAWWRTTQGLQRRR
jgi:hypothetical protein